MAKIVILVAAVCALQVISARVVREAPAPRVFTDLAKQADEALGLLHSSFLNIVGVKNDGELTNLIQTQGRTYATKLQDLATQLGEEAKVNAGKADDVFSGLQTSLSNTVAELKKKNPEVFTNVEKFQQSFQDQLRTVLKDTEQFNTQLRKEGKEVSSKVEEVLKQIYDNTVQTAQKVATEIETTVKQNKSR